MNTTDQTMAEGLGDRFGFGVHLQFAVDVLDMKIDGAHANLERDRGGLVAMTFDQ